MRVLHIASFLDADGAYGGPLSVVKQQAEHLAARGHDVTVITGWDGRDNTVFEGVTLLRMRARALPHTGFAGLISFAAIPRAHSLSREADVVHLHASRDLITLPAGLAIPTNKPLVIQAHGMLRADTRLKARLFDTLLTRPALRRADVQLCLTEEEAEAVPQVAGTELPVERMRNGVEIPAVRATWDGRHPPEVLFCARLHRRKRPIAFVEMASWLLRHAFDGFFSIYGADEGELPGVMASIHRLGVESRVSYRGTLARSNVIPRMAAAQAFVSPSFDEPFGMSLVEAMSVGLPSVLTTRTGLSAELQNRVGSRVTDGSPAEMGKAMLSFFDDPGTWSAASRGTVRTVRERYSADEVAGELEALYKDLIQRKSSQRARTVHR